MKPEASNLWKRRQSAPKKKIFNSVGPTTTPLQNWYLEPVAFWYLIWKDFQLWKIFSKQGANPSTNPTSEWIWIMKLRLFLQPLLQATNKYHCWCHFISPSVNLTSKLKFPHRGHNFESLKSWTATGRQWPIEKYNKIQHNTIYSNRAFNRRSNFQFQLHLIFFVFYEWRNLAISWILGSCLIIRVACPPRPPELPTDSRSTLSQLPDCHCGASRVV